MLVGGSAFHGPHNRAGSVCAQRKSRQVLTLAAETLWLAPGFHVERRRVSQGAQAPPSRRERLPRVSPWPDGPALQTAPSGSGFTECPMKQAGGRESFRCRAASNKRLFRTRR